METGKHLSRTLKVICDNFQSSVSASSESSTSSDSHLSLSPHPHLHPSRREIESKSDSPRSNCLHHPRHGRRPRPLGILPSRNQPVFFKMSREHQQTTSVRERSMTKTRNPEVCRWLSLSSMYVQSLSLRVHSRNPSLRRPPFALCFQGRSVARPCGVL